jgi:poly(3-hydroxybutyrate) depolymerase
MRVLLAALAVLTFLGAGTPPVSAQQGWWTHCWVNLNDGTQIAVVNADTAEACWSAARKCAHGRQGATNHSTMKVLESAPRVERCEIPY